MDELSGCLDIDGRFGSGSLGGPLGSFRGSHERSGTPKELDGELIGAKVASRLHHTLVFLRIVRTHRKKREPAQVKLSVEQTGTPPSPISLLLNQ